jgi:hypothetical protein
MKQITEALQKLYDKHRIVFWYDANKELKAEYDSVDIKDVEKIELNNNEFSIKYHILREKPEQKFLIYNHGSKPQDKDNWLLDVLLAYSEFKTDQSSIWLTELELGVEFAELIQEHINFFTSNERRQYLKKKLSKQDTHKAIRIKMLSVCANTEPKIDQVLENLLGEYAEDKTDIQEIIIRSNLSNFLWQQVHTIFGYNSDSPNIKDFAIKLFD